MPTMSVNLSTTKYVQVSSLDDRPLVLQAHRDTVRVTMSVGQPAISNSVFHTLEGGQPPMTFNSFDSKVWALAMTDRSSLVVSEVEPIPVKLMDNDGLPIHTFRGLSVHVADTHDRPINEFFHQDNDITTTLAVATSSQDTQVEVVSAVGFSVGDALYIHSEIDERSHPEITAIVGNVFSIDRPLDSSAPIGSVVEHLDFNLNVDGSTTPVSFRMEPHDGEEWHIRRFTVSMIHAAAADDSKFGGITALTNGIVLRRYDGVSGRFATFTSWKINADMASDAYDVSYGDKAGAGKYSTRVRFSIYVATGATPKIDGAVGDYLEVLVQDDLTGLDALELKGQGHIEGH